MLEDEQVLALFWKEGTGNRLQGLSKIAHVLMKRVETKIQDSDTVARKL